MKRILPGVGYDVYETADGVSLVIDGTAFRIEQTHPYKVQGFTVPDTGTTATFGVYFGAIFGIGQNNDEDYSPVREGNAWSVQDDIFRVKIGNSISKILGPVTHDSNYLDDRNVGMKYSATLDTAHNNVLYVEVKADSNALNGFEARLELKTVVDAKGDYLLSLPRTEFIEGHDKVHQEDVWHTTPASPTNPFVVSSVSFGTQTGNISLHQKWNLYENEHKRMGIYQIPVAYMTYVDNKWKVRQVLRSDIFFPYGLNTKTFYVGSHVDDFIGTCTV